MAALSIALEHARRRRGMAPENVAAQHRAELRLEEIVKSSAIPEEFEALDRGGNLRVETAFARCYQLVDSDEERSAIARAFVVWQNDERHENRIIRDLANDLVELQKANNPSFIDGSWMPEGSGGAA